MLCCHGACVSLLSVGSCAWLVVCVGVERACAQCCRQVVWQVAAVIFVHRCGRGGWRVSVVMPAPTPPPPHRLLMQRPAGV